MRSLRIAVQAHPFNHLDSFPLICSLFLPCLPFDVSQLSCRCYSSPHQSLTPKMVGETTNLPGPDRHLQENFMIHRHVSQRTATGQLNSTWNRTHRSLLPLKWDGLTWEPARRPQAVPRSFSSSKATKPCQSKLRLISTRGKRPVKMSMLKPPIQ